MADGAIMPSASCHCHCHCQWDCYYQRSEKHRLFFSTVAYVSKLAVLILILDGLPRVAGAVKVAYYNMNSIGVRWHKATSVGSQICLGKPFDFSDIAN